MKIKYLLCLTLFTGILMYARAQSKTAIQFGIIADPQYGNVDSHGTRFYRNSLNKLNSAIASFNKEKLQFLVNLGDITDRNPADLDTVLQTLSKYQGQMYTTTGNHDYTDIKDNGSLYRKLGMPAAYYSFKKDHWRFIMLNTNEISSYANIAGTPKEKELHQMLQKIKENKGKNGYPYNGGISQKQLKWLKKQLELATKRHENVLVFSHHPLGCAIGLTALNAEEIMNTIQPFSCVKAVISGHHHPGAFCQIGNIPCVVLEGMIETASQNSYGKISLYPNKIIINGQGRMHSREINFK